jgi:predicted nucleic acid-binding protein
MTFVLDSSVALSWAFEDEASPSTEALLDRASREGAIVPDLWYVELANVLVGVERRGRLTSEKVALFVRTIDALRLQVDPLTTARTFGEIRSLALAERLTTYDATYLDLAMRRGLPPATLDADLVRAASRRGAPILS